MQVVTWNTGPGWKHPEQVLPAIAALAAQDAVDPTVRRWTLRAVRLVRRGDVLGEARAIARAALRDVRYTPDPIVQLPGLRAEPWEWVQAPRHTLEDGAGDCDDIEGLISSALQSIGRRVRYQVVAYRPEQPRHVWTEVQGPEGWIVVDVIPRRPRVGVGAAVRGVEARIYDARGREVSGMGRVVRVCRCNPDLGAEIPPEVMEQGRKLLGDVDWSSLADKAWSAIKSGWNTFRSWFVKTVPPRTITTAEQLEAARKLVASASSYIQGPLPSVQDAAAPGGWRVMTREEFNANLLRDLAPAAAPTGAPVETDPEKLRLAEMLRQQAVESRRLAAEQARAAAGGGVQVAPPGTVPPAQRPAVAARPALPARPVVVAPPGSVPAAQRPAAPAPAAPVAAAPRPIVFPPGVAQFMGALQFAQAQRLARGAQAAAGAYLRAAGIGVTPEQTPIPPAGRTETGASLELLARQMVYSVSRNRPPAEQQSRTVAFQRAIGLPATGDFDAATRDAAARLVGAWVNEIPIRTWAVPPAGAVPPAPGVPPVVTVTPVPPTPTETGLPAAPVAPPVPAPGAPVGARVAGGGIVIAPAGTMAPPQPAAAASSDRTALVIAGIAALAAMEKRRRGRRAA